MIIHIVPTNDIEEHVEVGATCRCNPKVEFEDGNMIIVHNAFDLREVVEQANKILEDETKNKN